MTRITTKLRFPDSKFGTLITIMNKNSQIESIRAYKQITPEIKLHKKLVKSKHKKKSRVFQKQTHRIGHSTNHQEERFRGH